MPPGRVLAFDSVFLVELVIQWMNIAILGAVLILLLYKPVRKFLADRAERIRDELDSANLTTENALKLKANYEKLIANIEVEREDLLTKAHHAAVEKSDRIVFAAREEAKHLIVKAREEISAEKENAAEDIKKQIIELSTFMAGRFIEVSIDKNTQDRYVDEALSDWSGLTWQS